MASLTTGAGTTVKQAFSAGLATTGPAATIVRTRGECLFTTLTAVDADVTGAFGIIIVSSDAATIGITAIPGPISDIENDWYVWEPLNLHSRSTTESESSLTQSHRIKFDSRGMRKIKLGDTSVLVLEIRSATAGYIIQGSCSFREQVKL